MFHDVVRRAASLHLTERLLPIVAQDRLFHVVRLILSAEVYQTFTDFLPDRHNGGSNRPTPFRIRQ